MRISKMGTGLLPSFHSTSIKNHRKLTRPVIFLMNGTCRCGKSFFDPSYGSILIESSKCFIFFEFQIDSLERFAEDGEQATLQRQEHLK